MNPFDRNGEEPFADEIFDSVVVAYQEALAAGATPPAIDETTIPPDLLTRLSNAQACLSALEQARRARDQAHSRSPAGRVEASRADPLVPNGRIGRFQIIREVGRGGHGVVFLAYDAALNRQVALKLPRPEVVVTPELSRRFTREAQAAGSLAHPNLVAVYEVGDAGPFCFIASAYCDGPNLAQWLKSRTEPVCLREAAELVAAVADGVDLAHRHGILHRDIKPSNVLLETPSGGAAHGRAPLVPKLTDFGLAKILEVKADETRSQALLGTPAYMAPEQAGGRNDQIGPATDVYGLGAVLYELLTGLAPFRGDSDVQVLRQIVERDPVRPRLLRLEVPCDLEAICLKCLEKEPSHRYLGAGEVAADLRRFLAGQPTLARPLTRTQRANKWVRRRPALAGLMTVSAAALLMLVALTMAYIWQLRVARHTADTLRHEAVASAATSRRHERDANQLLYASRMHMAYQWLEQGEIERVAEILNPYEASGPLADLRGFEWFHLKSRMHGERLTLKGHEGEVYAVAFSPGGRELASGAQDGTIRFWDPANGQALTTIHAHASCVNSLAYSPDGSLLASGSCDHTIRLWNATTRELVDTLTGHPDNVQCVAFSPSRGDLLASCGNDRFVNVWDVATREVIHSFDTKQQAVNSLAWRSDGATLFLACNTRPLGEAESAGIEIDVDENRAVATHPFAAWAVAASAERAEFCMGLGDGTLRKITDGAPHTLNPGTHYGSVYALAFSPDGGRVASGGRDRTIRIWDTTLNRCVRTLTGHSGRVQALAFSPDGQALASGSFDGTIKLWDMRSQDGEVLTTDLYLDSLPPQNSVAISPDFQRLAVVHRHNMVRILNLEDAQVHSDLQCVGRPCGLQFMDAGQVLFGPGLNAENSADEWDIEQHASRKTHRLPAANLRSLALLPNRDTLVVADSSVIELFDTATEQVFRTLKIREPADRPPPQTYLCSSPNGADFAISSETQVASLILLAGDKRSALESVPGVRAISNDASFLAVVGNIGLDVILVDPHSQRQWATLRHTVVVNHAAFAPDAQTLATVCADGAVYLWNVRTGQEITRFETRSGAGVTVQFSLDGRQLAAVTRSDESAYYLADGSPLRGNSQGTAHVFIWSGLDGLGNGP